MSSFKRFDVIPFFKNKTLLAIGIFIIPLWYWGDQVWINIKISLAAVAFFFIFDSLVFRKYDKLFQEGGLAGAQLVIYKAWCVFNFIIASWLFAILIYTPIFGVYQIFSKQHL